MAAYIVVDIVNSDTAEANREAIGRLYAERREEVWPIRATFPGGAFDPDITHGTFYYWDPRPNVGGTKVAFGPAGDQDEEALMAFCLGRTVDTTLGDVTLPGSTQELEENWFA